MQVMTRWQETIFAWKNSYFASLDCAANSPCTPVLIQISLNTFRDTKSRAKESQLQHPVSHALHTPGGQKGGAGRQSDQNPQVWGAKRNTDSSSNIQHRNPPALSHTGRLWQPHLFTADPQSPYQLCSLSTTGMRATPSSAKDFLLWCWVTDSSIESWLPQP